jgi:hypothetical protein
MKNVVGTYVYEDHYAVADAKRRKRKFQWFISILAILACVSAIIVISLNQSPSAKDSGVTACQQMASTKTATKSSNAPMTVEQRDQKKAVFQNSHYADLQVAGANVVDTVYAMDNAADDSIAASYEFMTKIEAQWGNLQVACLNHGVRIPGLG